MSRRFTWSGRARSFRHAFGGLFSLLRTEYNAWIHAAATLAVVALAAALRLGRDEWLWLILCVTLVWVAEAFNTALERLADAVSDDYHPAIKRAKDLGAAAVLIAAIGATVVAAIVFGPPSIKVLMDCMDYMD